MIGPSVHACGLACYLPTKLTSFNNTLPSNWMNFYVMEPMDLALCFVAACVAQGWRLGLLYTFGLNGLLNFSPIWLPN